jgi:hypothetical protein
LFGIAQVQIDFVSDAVPLPVLARDLCPFIALVEAMQFSTVGQGASDAGGAIAGERAHFHRCAHAGCRHEHAQQCALFRRDQHSADAAKLFRARPVFLQRRISRRDYDAAQHIRPMPG